MLVPRLMARALLATLLVFKDSLEASVVRWPSVSLIITVASKGRKALAGSLLKALDGFGLVEGTVRSDGGVG